MRVGGSGVSRSAPTGDRMIGKVRKVASACVRAVTVQGTDQRTNERTNDRTDEPVGGKLAGREGKGREGTKRSHETRNALLITRSSPLSWGRAGYITKSGNLGRFTFIGAMQGEATWRSCPTCDGTNGRGERGGDKISRFVCVIKTVFAPALLCSALLASAPSGSATEDRFHHSLALNWDTSLPPLPIGSLTPSPPDRVTDFSVQTSSSE
ncbi:unnamed protein product [Calypogeia fissa]